MIPEIKIEAAQKGNMQYSDLISSKIQRALKEISSVKSLAELKNIGKYSDVIDSFVPSKKGRPWDQKTVFKKKPHSLFIGKYFKNYREIHKPI